MARPSNLNWLYELVDLFQGSIVNVPTDYRSQVLAVKKLLESDETGIISSLLDFGISSSADVSFSVEVENEKLYNILNDWLSDVNGALLGKIPIGIEALAKEYYRERWKGSSMLVLRTAWETIDGMRLPTKMWFVDGEDVSVSSNSQIVTLGDQKYSIIVDPKDKRKNIQLPTNKNEKIFVQKPYCTWGTDYPVPFLIQRGLYKNAVMMKNLVNKGEVVVAKALEYLMVVKKGTEALAKENRSEFIYSDEDLKGVKEQLSKVSNERSSQGVPSYITNFDTEIEHLIPDYERILKPTLFIPVERRILAGLGMVDIVESTSSSRREGTLNPKPFIGELNSGVKDFAALIKDLLISIINENKATHPKYFSSKKTLEVRNTPVKAFMTDDYKTMLRSLYDRGVLSKQTFVEVVGETGYNEERDRRVKEDDRGDNKIFYPPVIQNLEQHQNDPDGETPNEVDVDEKEVTPDKQGPEARNYDAASKVPYTSTFNLPDNVKNTLTNKAQEIYLEVFNEAYDENSDVELSEKLAWNIVKLQYKPNEIPNKKWTKIKKANLEDTFETANIDDLLKLQNLKVLGKKQELLEKFLSQK